MKNSTQKKSGKSASKKLSTSSLKKVKGGFTPKYNAGNGNSVSTKPNA